ncbi:FecR family protein [Chitinophaga sp. MM2321]|uniref:FecR family protein n=1 Tax=Chitinophaga sp. MM2321 TaxID=3137178 RepID=UPI0032D59262
MEHLNEETWEFIRDDRFIQWVLDPDTTNIAYWEHWMAEHPHHIDSLMKAREIVISMRDLPQPGIDPALPEEIYAAIDQGIATEQSTSHVLLTPVRRRIPYRWMSVAAAIAGGIVLVSVFINNNNKNKPAVVQIDSQEINGEVIRTNKTTDNQVAYLTDGSTVVLQSGASIHHETFLQRPQREVYLKGDAFFNIAKDAQRPFFVYTPKVAIRVLGTSFNVKEDKDGNLTVMVKTGKISVYNLADAGHHGYVVTPNHKIRFNPHTAVFVTDSMNVEEEQHVQPPAQIMDFAFEDTPVKEIFKSLEMAYSVKIIADEATFGKCLVTTTITHESFEDKLKIICAAVNATYKISGNRVYISGKPCS